MFSLKIFKFYCFCNSSIADCIEMSVCCTFSIFGFVIVLLLGMGEREVIRDVQGLAGSLETLCCLGEQGVGISPMGTVCGELA